MLSRNDNPYTKFDYNFSVDSVFNNVIGNDSGIVSNEFLLLDSEQFLLLNGTNFLLLGN